MKHVMEAKDISRSLARMAHEIVEDLGDADRLLLVGIHSGGVPLAHRLANHVEQIEGNRPQVGEMDITLYRDDLYTGLEHPVLGDTRLPDSLTGAHVVLVDRGHRELPVSGNYVGRALDTDKGDRVRVEAGLELSDQDCVVVEARGDT